MINPTGKKLEKLLFGIFDDAIKGVDTYNHSGSLWLIFTDEMKWVVEYTKSQTLWYNYYFFKNEMEIIGLDCVENKDLIQKWFESRYLNINQVKHTDFPFGLGDEKAVEDTIQNGVKNTLGFKMKHEDTVEDTIQNGVKIKPALESHEGFMIGTPYVDKFFSKEDVEGAIQNGVEETIDLEMDDEQVVDYLIQNGVKETRSDKALTPTEVEDTLQNGIKETKPSTAASWTEVDNTIQNGVKEIKEISDYSLTSEIFKVKCKKTIKEGVKEIKHQKNNPHSYHHKWTIDWVLQKGVRETHPQKFNLDGLADDIVENGVKEVRTDDGYVNYFRQNYKFNNVIEKIVKDC